MNLCPTMQMAIKTFGEFLNDEIRKRNMSAREFALFIGVSHGTVDKFLDYGTKETGYPSLGFLLKLSIATKTDICHIIGLIAPEVVASTATSPDAMILSQRIEQLPDHIREAVDVLLARYDPSK